MTSLSKTNKTRKTLSSLWASITHNISLIIIALFVLFPIFWIAISAFKLPVDVKKPSVIFQPTLMNFQILFRDFDFAHLLWNSLLICVFVVVDLVCTWNVANDLLLLWSSFEKVFLLCYALVSFLEQVQWDCRFLFISALKLLLFTLPFVSWIKYINMIGRCSHIIHPYWKKGIFAGVAMI